MGFAERAKLLAGLGILRQKGALKDEQFNTLKGNVLKNDKPITEAVLAVLDSFWGLRCEGTLNDNEYQEQLRGILGSLEEDLDGAAHKSSSAPVAPSIQAQQIVRQEEPENTVASGQSAAGDASKSAPPDTSSKGNSGNGSGSRGGAAAEGVAADASQAGGDSATPSANASAPSPSAGEKRKLGQVSAGDSREAQTNVEAYAGTVVKDEVPDTHGGGPETYERPPDKDAASEGITFNTWRTTDVFHFPGKSFHCDDGTTGSLVDTTAALLQSSEAKAFPRFSEGGRSKSDSQRLYRQKKMYFVLKKLLVCDAGDGGQLVFRATGEEIENAVPEVAEGKVSTDEYMHAVLKHVADTRHA